MQLQAPSKYSRRSAGRAYVSPSTRLLHIALITIALFSLSFYYYTTLPATAEIGKKKIELAPTIPTEAVHEANHGAASSSPEASSPEDTLLPGAPGSVNKVAIIIPYIGPHLPPYFPLFLQSALRQTTVDFLIFHTTLTTNIPPVPANSNVKFINLGALTDASLFANLHARVALYDSANARTSISAAHATELTRLLTAQFSKHPYTLVEYKPAYGHIFHDYISEYSHWGYSDFDVVFGDLKAWISAEELEDYDIVTYSHGDQGSVYLRGQFTFHKNSPVVNNAWRDCLYLTELDKRYPLAGYPKPPKFRFESAEGCYSWSVMKVSERSGLRVLYQVKALTDFHKEGEINKSGVVWDGKGLWWGKEATEFDGDGGGVAVYTNDEAWTKIDSYEERDTPLKNNRGCMFWAPSTYQRDICFHGVSKGESVRLIDGRVEKATYKVGVYEGGVASGALMHFQEWKRRYRGAEFRALSDWRGEDRFLINSDGVVKLPRDNEPSLKPAIDWTEGALGLQLPLTYCVEFDSRRADNDNKATLKCVDYASWYGKGTTVVKVPDASVAVNVAADPTIALVIEFGTRNGEEGWGRVKVALKNVRNWKNRPAVLVIHVTPDVLASVTVEEFTAKLKTIGVDSHKGCTIALVATRVFNRNALSNMACDAVRTRFYLRGVVPDLGMVVSAEAVEYFGVAAAVESGEGRRGSVFLVPGFYLKKAGEVGTEQVLEMWGKGVSNFAGRFDREVECGALEGCPPPHDNRVEDIVERVGGLWVAVTREDLQLPRTKMKKGSIHKRQEENVAVENVAVENVSVEIEEALTGIAGDVLNAVYEGDYDSFGEMSGYSQPVLFLDAFTTQGNALSFETARLVEELDGRYCAVLNQVGNLLAARSNLKVISGAFVAVTEKEKAMVNKLKCEEGKGGTGQCSVCTAVGDGESLTKMIREDQRIVAKTSSFLGELINT